MGDREALPLLIAAVRDPKAPEPVRDAALRASRRSAPTRPSRRWSTCCEGGQLGAERQPRVIAALGRFKARAAVEPLVGPAQEPPRRPSGRPRPRRWARSGQLERRRRRPVRGRSWMTPPLEVRKAAIAALGRAGRPRGDPRAARRPPTPTTPGSRPPWPWPPCPTSARCRSTSAAWPTRAPTSARPRPPRIADHPRPGRAGARAARRAQRAVPGDPARAAAGLHRAEADHGLAASLGPFPIDGRRRRSRRATRSTSRPATTAPAASPSDLEAGPGRSTTQGQVDLGQVLPRRRRPGRLRLRRDPEPRRPDARRWPSARTTR